MTRIHKKIISVLLPAPFVFAITFCCCLDVSAEEPPATFSTEHRQETHELEKAHHHEHQNHSHGEGQECFCPKHLSFLSAQSVDAALVSASPMLAKSFMANLRFENIVFLAALSNHSQGPPREDHLDHVSLPVYLKISNLRI